MDTTIRANDGVFEVVNSITVIEVVHVHYVHVTDELVLSPQHQTRLSRFHPSVGMTGHVHKGARSRGPKALVYRGTGHEHGIRGCGDDLLPEGP